MRYLIHAIAFRRSVGRHSGKHEVYAVPEDGRWDTLENEGDGSADSEQDTNCGAYVDAVDEEGVVVQHTEDPGVHGEDRELAGEPKGIILTHANLLTQVAAVQQRYPLSQPRVLQQSGHSFDASLFQILMSLSTGGTLVMTSCRHDPEAVAKIICNERITTTLAAPSEYQM
jgi:hypothetical protein